MMKNLIQQSWKAFVTLGFSLVLTFQLTAQSSKLANGTITNAQGSGLPGVTVVEKGTSNGTVTDLDGKFSIELTTDSPTLVISSVGMISQEIEFTEQTSIDVVLEDDVLGLDEIVVVGYGIQRKADLTGAVSTLQGEELIKGVSANLNQQLAGKITGITAMSRSGQPGAEDIDLMIRGVSSNRNNAPLVLVDGIERGMSRIDPNDIESVTVLKDAASAAVYGVKGANGVILITTKRAKSGQAEINYSSDFGTQSPLYLPDMMNSYQYSTYLNEAKKNEAERSGSEYVPVFTDEEIEAFRNGTAPNTNWWDETMNKTAPMQQHHLSISNGNERISYHTSFGVLNQKGLYELAKYKRYNFRANIDGKITDNLSMNVNLAGRLSNRSESARNEQAFGLMLQSYPTFAATTTIDGKEELSWNGLNQSPVGDALNSGYNRIKNNTFESSFKINYSAPFLEGLNASFLYSFDRTNGDNKKLETPYTYYQGDLKLKSQSEVELGQSMDEKTRQTYQFTLSYDKQIGDHTIGALFVSEASDYKTHSISAFRDGFASYELDQLFAGSVQNQTTGGKATEFARIGNVARLNYNFKNKYLLQVNGRLDKSFNFPRDAKPGFFPATSVAWRLSEEDFLADNNWVSNLKLRMSYGIYGNDNISPYQYLAYYKFADDDGGTIFGNSGYTAGVVPNVYPNPDITWEEAKSFNVGIDYSLLEGQITGDFEAFTKQTESLLVPPQNIPTTFGITPANLNVGKSKNQGIEATLRYKKVLGDLGINVEGNVTYATSKIIEITEAEGVPDGMKITGRPFGSQFGLIEDGYFTDADDVANSPVQMFGAYQAGDIKYKDLDGNDTINGDDRTYIARSNMPELVFALNMSISFKGLELTAAFQGATRYASNREFSPFVNDQNSMAMFEDSWRVGNEGARFPRLYTGNSDNNSQKSSFFYEDAWFLKLRNAELAYNVPQIKVLNKIGIKGLRFSVSGTNLLSFSNLKEFDPEADNLDTHPFYYMQMRTINFGVRVKL